MAQNEDDISLLKELLNVNLPQSYRDFPGVEEGGTTIDPPLAGFPISLDLSSAWGATEFLRAARADLEPYFIVIRIMDSKAVCMDLKKGDDNDAPIVEIDLENQSPPVAVSDSLSRYLAELRSNARKDSFVRIRNLSKEDDHWFNQGLKRLDYHMGELSYGYDHKDGGQLPRSHAWRPYRFCVQDVILGITTIRHDRKYNRLEVDVFLTARIPEYKEDSGCRALTLILLSDAYKSGGSMEIKFSEHVEGGKVPYELCELASSLGVNLSHIKNGGITPKEAKELYLSLSGFRDDVSKQIMELEGEGKLRAASVCYAMHHGVWTAPEIETILFSSRFPDTILTGSFPAEAWHLFHHDLFHGRNALMGGYLDRKLTGREHNVQEGGEEVVEMEDDERAVDISFDPESCVKIYRIEENEEGVGIPWLYNDINKPLIAPGESLKVLLRARDEQNLNLLFDNDLQKAIGLKSVNGDMVCIMVPGDFKRLEMVEICRKASDNNIGIIICPEFLNQLNQEVSRRFEAVKVMRQ
ncbi:MAG: SMI1/KNR4 family protein [Thermodesulfobacteriota bacterium]|nr:SMI1/KNR4 family protein [Thermodesulfobacteriota bacterium]